MISSSMSNYEFYQPMGAPNGRYPQMGAGGRAPVRASSVTDIHSLYSGLPGMLIILPFFEKFPKMHQNHYCDFFERNVKKIMSSKSKIWRWKSDSEKAVKRWSRATNAPTTTGTRKHELSAMESIYAISRYFVTSLNPNWVFSRLKVLVLNTVI